jgi:hypothetical protein
MGGFGLLKDVHRLDCRDLAAVDSGASGRGGGHRCLLHLEAETETWRMMPLDLMEFGGLTGYLTLTKAVETGAVVLVAHPQDAPPAAAGAGAEV